MLLDDFFFCVGFAIAIIFFISSPFLVIFLVIRAWRWVAGSGRPVDPTPPTNPLPHSRLLIDSPLHVVIRNNNIDVAKILLAGQCDVHAMNAEGLTPLQLATQVGNTEMINLLLQHGAGRQANPTPHSTSHPYTGNMSTPPPICYAPAPPQPPRNRLWVIGGLILIALVFYAGYQLYGSLADQANRRALGKFEQIWDRCNKVSNPDSAVKRAIQQAHTETANINLSGCSPEFRRDFVKLLNALGQYAHALDEIPEGILDGFIRGAVNSMGGELDGGASRLAKDFSHARKALIEAMAEMKNMNNQAISARVW